MSALCQQLLEKLTEAPCQLSPEEQAHLSQCQDCLAAARALGELAATAAEPAAQLLAGFASRVRAAEARAGRRRANAAPWRAGLLAGAMAAAGAVAVGLALDLASPSGPQPQPTASRPETAVEEPAAIAAEEVFSGEAFASAADADGAELDTLLEDPEI